MSVKPNKFYLIDEQINKIISQKILFFETMKSKVTVSLYQTPILLVLVSPRNLYNSLKVK